MQTMMMHYDASFNSTFTIELHIKPLPTHWPSHPSDSLKKGESSPTENVMLAHLSVEVKSTSEPSTGVSYPPDIETFSSVCWKSL